MPGHESSEEEDAASHARPPAPHGVPGLANHDTSGAAAAHRTTPHTQQRPWHHHHPFLLLATALAVAAVVVAQPMYVWFSSICPNLHPPTHPPTYHTETMT